MGNIYVIKKAKLIEQLSECLSRDAALILDGDGKEHLIIPGSVLSERIP